MANAKKYTLIAFLIFALSATIYLIIKTTGYSTKANFNSTNLENSYIFASPLQAKADGLEKIRLTIFVLNDKGIGIPNQNISINTSINIKIDSIQSITDTYGKAIFDLSSNVLGTYTINSKSNNINLPQEIKVLFY